MADVADVAIVADVTDVAIVANVAGKADVIDVTDVVQSHCAYTYVGENVVCSVVISLQHQVFYKKKTQPMSHLAFFIFSKYV